AGAPIGVEPSTTSDSSIIASSAWRWSPIRSSRREAGSSSKTIPSVTAWPSAVLPIRRSHVGARVSASDGSGNQRSCWLELRLGVGTQGFSAIGGTGGGGHLNSYLLPGPDLLFCDSLYTR